MRMVRLSLLGGVIALIGCAEQPKRDVWAVVVEIEPHISPRWNTDELVVTARTSEGLLGTKSVLKARLNCQVGDTVHASVRGVALTLDDRACER